MKTLAIAALTLFGFTAGANAGIIYHFDFTNLSHNFSNFSLEITEPGYIQTTGLFPIAPPLATSVGYTVQNLGENVHGWFAFSNSGGSLTDSGFNFSSTSFLFEPAAASGGYYTSAGVYSGSVTGDVPSGGFNGRAQLTITDTSTATPEPSSFALLALGAAGILFRRLRH